MAVSFPIAGHRPADLPVHAPVSRPSLVVIEGGRSAAAVDRRRMYLRRRVFAVVVGLALLALLGGAVSAVVGPDAAPASSVEAYTYTVAPGDTLWGIAGTLDTGEDRRLVVDLLAAANGGTSVQPGQELLIPAEVVAMAA